MEKRRQRKGRYLPFALMAALFVGGGGGAGISPAAAQYVSGVSGCIYLGSVETGTGGMGSLDCPYQGGYTGWQSGAFVTAGEVNNAFNVFQSTINTQINQSVNPRIDDLYGHVTSLYNTNAAQQQSINDHSSQISDLYNRDSNQQGQINDLYSRDTTQAGQITNLTDVTNLHQQMLTDQIAAYNDLSARLAQAESNIVTLDTRVSQHDQTLAAHNSTLSQQSATLSNHSTRLLSTEANVAGLQSKALETEGVVGQQGNTIDQQGDQLAEQGSQISEQTEQIANQGEQIAEQSDQLAEQGSQISEQADQIADQGEQIAEQSEQLAEQGAELGQQGNTIAELQDKALTTDEAIAGLNTTVANQGVTLADHENRIIANEEKIADHETRIDTAEATLVSHGNTLADHEDRITTNEETIADHGTRIGQAETTIANHGATLANHENRIIVNEEKIADHDTRIGQNEGDIASLQATSVFYNTDAAGNKVGGLTFNDGTGKAVELGNVAAGKLSSDAVNVAQLSSAVSALGGGAFIDADGAIKGPTYIVGGQTYGNVGDALKATNEIGVQYSVDENGKRTNDIVLSGSGSGPVSIHNLAAGVADSDAANVGQVNAARTEAISYVDQRFSELGSYSQENFQKLGGEIASTRREARAGVASAMAMASMRYADTPGKVTLTAGFGSFGGTQAVSAGFGYTSLDGRFRWNAGLSRNFGNDNYMGFNAGLSVTLD